MKHLLSAGAASLALALSGCAGMGAPAAPEAAAARANVPSVAEAEAFLAAAEAELEAFSEYHARVAWVQATYINFDTDWLAARAGSEATQLAVRLANETKRFEGVDLPQELERKMQVLRAGITLPAPSGAAAADELARIATELESAYATARFTVDGKEYDVETGSDVIESSRDPETLKAIWEGWHATAAPSRDEYARLVEIANAGARELGFANVADMWLSNYDMPAADMEAEVERLWLQVAPLYRELHCHVRAKLSEHYGPAVQPATGPIRADLLGNMWAQQWANVGDLVAPPSAAAGYDLTEALKAAGYDEERMMRVGEEFFSSLGFAPLPETFWERSLIKRPADREVVCHASAWNVDNVDDLRVKMCTQINAEDFQTVHHELGHNYYQRAYNKKDFLFREGAHDGFHEAVGDFVALSITPEYLKQIGLIEEVPPASADLGLLMDLALDKIAFLPFGLLMDKWRWEVFRGEVAPEAYTAEWEKLRLQYQGIASPGPRPAEAFDPGAKYHIPANVPYLRYFLSFVMQFQFHEAACERAGWTGPLHRCSVYGDKEVGQRFNAMLEMGASQPWPEALEAFTGAREMDGRALVEYFDPLIVWLKQENAGRACGW